MSQTKVILNKETLIHNHIVCDVYWYIRSLINEPSLNKPLNRIESFLLSVLSDWYKKRNCRNVIKNEFDNFVNRGWFPKYDKCYEVPEKYAIQLNENGYYKYLEENYFKSFFNPTNNSYVWNCSHNNMIKSINILKAVVGNNILTKKFDDITSNKSFRFQKDYLLQKYHSDGKKDEVYALDTIKRVVMDAFPIEDIILPYNTWKFNIELDPERLKRNLFYSLFYNLPKGDDRKHILIPQLYYKYYGFVEGHYFDTVFEGLHGEFGTEEQRLLSRLLALNHEQKIMKSVLSKYDTFCEKNGIPHGKYLGSFLSHTPNKKDDIEPQVSTIHSVELGIRSESFTNEQLCYLVELLAKDGKTFKPLDDNNKDKFLCFIGAKNRTAAYNIQKIEWNGNVDSLKYFIYKLYEMANGKNSKLKPDTWRTVANIFMFPNRKNVFAKLNYTTIVGRSRNKIEKTLSSTVMDYINECFLKAKNYRQ